MAADVSEYRPSAPQRLLMTLIRGVSRLPLWVLYRFSDLTYLLLTYVVRYRHKVIDSNLTAAYPEKNAAERRAIRRDFYRNFADYIFETVKMLTISDKEMMRRMTFDHEEIADLALEQGRPVVVYFSHCFNWEWATSVLLWSRYGHDPDMGMFQVYRPLRNRFMDHLMLEMRSRFNSRSLPKRTAFLTLVRYLKRGIPTMTGFMSDQKPSHGDPHYSLRFLRRNTQVITGTEAVARSLNAVVVYWDIHKLSRGHYRIDVRKVTDSPTQLPEHALTDRYFQLLQQTIDRRPGLWLWSHKRWKPVWTE